MVLVHQCTVFASLQLMFVAIPNEYMNVFDIKGSVILAKVARSETKPSMYAILSTSLMNCFKLLIHHIKTYLLLL